MNKRVYFRGVILFAIFSTVIKIAFTSAQQASSLRIKSQNEAHVKTNAQYGSKTETELCVSVGPVEGESVILRPSLQVSPTPSKMDVALQAQYIILDRKRELVAQLRQIVDMASPFEFTDEQVKKWALELEAALKILEVHPMMLEYSVVQDAKEIYTKCVKYWGNYFDETKSALTSIYGLIKKYF